MNIQFSENYVIGAETGEVLDMKRRITELSERMMEMKARKAAFESDNALLMEEIEKLKDNIKNEVLATQEGATYNGLRVVWSKGKTTWDAKSLNKYAETHPDIEQFRKVGNPWVSFCLQKDMISDTYHSGAEL